MLSGKEGRYMKTIVGLSHNFTGMRSDCLLMCCDRCRLNLLVPVDKITIMTQEEYNKFSDEEKLQMKNETKYVHPDCTEFV